jgi:hypothetical protein
MYYSIIITPVMMPCDDPGETECLSLLKGGMSQLVSKHHGCNTSHTVIFLKTYGEETLRCPYKNYNSLNKWQDYWVLPSVFTLYNLLFCNDAPTKS